MVNGWVLNNVKNQNIKLLVLKYFDAEYGYLKVNLENKKTFRCDGKLVYNEPEHFYCLSVCV